MSKESAVLKKTVSRYGYVSGYCGPESLEDQARQLQGIFSERTFRPIDPRFKKLPVCGGSEGRHVTIRWQALASTYTEATVLVLRKLWEARNGRCAVRRGEFLQGSFWVLEKGLFETKRKAHAMARTAQSQRGADLLVMNAQLGSAYAGSVPDAAVGAMEENEFPLGVFETGIALLLNPTRLAHSADLGIDCPGDWCRVSTVRSMRRNIHRTPSFWYGSDGTLNFDLFDPKRPLAQYGCASAFVL